MRFGILGPHDRDEGQPGPNRQWVQIKLEQSTVFDGNRVIYLAGRQTCWHLVD